MPSVESRFETTDGWHRVHWFRLVELLGRAGLAALFLFETGIPTSIGAWAEQLLAIGLGVQAFVSYFSTRYRITSEAVSSTKGVVFRSDELIRRADVQTVTVAQSVWLRPLGLAVATVADDAGNEIKIGPVTRPVADGFAAALQTDDVTADVASDISAVGRASDEALPVGGDDGTDAVAPDGAQRAQPGPARAPTELASQPGALTYRVDVPIWKLCVISLVNVWLLVGIAVTWALVRIGLWPFAVIVAAVGLQLTIPDVIAARRFRLVVAGDDILVRQGLLSVSEARTTRQRSEYLRIDEPLMFRLFGLERVYLGNRDDVLPVSPAQPRGRWYGLAEPLLGVAVPDDSLMTAISDRSAGRFRMIGSAEAVAIGALVAVYDWKPGILAAAATGVATVGWYPRARLSRFGIAGDDRSVLTRTSFAPRRIRLYRVDHIDASSVSSVPAQRRTRLATLRFCGRAPQSNVRIPDLDAQIAARWEHVIATRADPGNALRQDGAPDPPDVERRDVPFPPAALPAALIGSSAAMAVALVLWAVLMIGSRITDPPGSVWRSSWLLWGGTATLLTVVVVNFAVRWRRVRVERWSLTGRTVERRYGMIIRRRTSLKRTHVSAAKWSQGPVERRLGLGSVTLLSRGVTNPDVTLQHLDAHDARYLADLHRAPSVSARTNAP